jgi:hypothetical protein
LLGALVEPPEQPDIDTAKRAKKNVRESVRSPLRLRMGRAKTRRQVSIAPLVMGASRSGKCREALEAADVTMVKVAVVGAVLVTGTVEVAPKLKVGGSIAPVGVEVRVAVKVTVPVNPPAGVTVMVDVLFVVPPGAVIVTLEDVIAKLGGMAVTITVEEAVVAG